MWKYVASGGSGVFILGAIGVATLSSGGTQLILSRWTTGYVINIASQYEVL